MKKTFLDLHPEHDSGENKNSEAVNKRVVGGGEPRGYYRKLRQRLQVALLVAYLVPLAILSFYFHHQFNQSLKRSGKLHLITIAESQKNTIDLFLQERVVNIFNLFHTRDFKVRPTQQDMALYLMHLREMSDAFVDVGFLEPSGGQISYAGPYPDLLEKNYSDEAWYDALIKNKRNYHISDIYLGFRQEPHFTIAVKQLIDGQYYIMRATLDPDKFYMFIRSIGKDKSVDSSIVNGQGKYQVVAPDQGVMLGKSALVPSNAASGATEINRGDQAALVAHARLQETPWILIVRQPLKLAYATMYKVQRIMLVSTLVLIVVLVSAIIVTTNRLLGRTQMIEEARRDLKSQLIHATKLASVGELAAGVAHEINNPLAIIASENGLIRDMLDPRFGMDCSHDAIREELDHIDEAVFRARDITQKLLSFVRKHDPRVTNCDMNSIVNEVVGGLKEREFLLANIEFVRDFDPDLPMIMVDPDKMRQVILNLVNNGGDAIEGDGTLTIKTSHDGENIRVSVTDTGKGMTSEQMEKIFLPFFTTKEVGKGTGLGLSISLSIVQSMGGRIEVQSMEGAGSSFTVLLPMDNSKEVMQNV